MIKIDFLFSGCLVAFLYFRTIVKKEIRKKRTTRGFWGKIMQFFGMMFYRYVRLTPPYLLVIGLIQVSMKWHHDHSLIQLPTLDYETCEKFWWRNALYVNTYFNMNERVSSPFNLFKSKEKEGKFELITKKLFTEFFV